MTTAIAIVFLLLVVPTFVLAVALFVAASRLLKIAEDLKYSVDNNIVFVRFAETEGSEQKPRVREVPPTWRYGRPRGGPPKQAG